MNRQGTRGRDHPRLTEVSGQWRHAQQQKCKDKKQIKETRAEQNEKPLCCLSRHEKVAPNTLEMTVILNMRENPIGQNKRRIRSHSLESSSNVILTLLDLYQCILINFFSRFGAIKNIIYTIKNKKEKKCS